ncbi:hypothetical protein CFP56_005157 [Quercus suber]|uniref:Uncharacterized protein n=1 Tax=Quercus suber TaxID=58331 RepID=A0AAW0IGI8_QUESU
MASKKFITLVVLFILMLLFASSKVESTGVAEASKLVILIRDCDPPLYKRHNVRVIREARLVPHMLLR